MTGITYDQVQYVRRISINVGETMQEFATRTLGDASQWPDIVNLNGLVPPYVTNDLALAASSKVVLYGAYLMVPGAIPFIEYHDDAELMFERDLDLLTYGGLADDGGDIKLVSGIDNLTQAIRIRVVTALKELLFHPTYGCDVRKLLGASNGPLSQIAAGAYVQGAVESDPRVERVTSTATETSGDVLLVHCEFIPIYGPNRKISMEF